jgi:hypothetical protein
MRNMKSEDRGRDAKYLPRGIGFLKMEGKTMPTLLRQETMPARQTPGAVRRDA